MGRIVIACFRPKPGQTDALHAVVRDHYGILATEGLVTDRRPIVMVAADGAVIEVFEWKSAAAIEAAHSNPRIADLWRRFEATCDYIPPTSIAGMDSYFPEFAPLANT